MINPETIRIGDDDPNIRKVMAEFITSTSNTGKTAPDDMERIHSLSPHGSFSFEDFEQKWKGADHQLKRYMIRFSGELDIKDAIEPVMLG